MVIESAPFFKKLQGPLPAVQEKIRKKIRHFDVPSLLKLLYSLGYEAKDLYFESHPSLSSAVSLFEDIFFSEGEYPKATILINLGLLTGNSPLPSYFQRKMDSGTIDLLLFTRFLSFFDHHLIFMTLGMDLPADNGWFFSDWNQTLKQYLSLLALNSTSTLWSLMQLCFPELKVEVYKSPRVLRMLSSSAILGATALGKDSFLGKKQKLTAPSFKIILTAEEMDYEMAVPWPVEIKTRLKELVFPLIHRINVYTRVILVVKNCKDRARLSATSYLGYRSLGKSHKPLQLLLFAGYPSAVY